MKSVDSTSSSSSGASSRHQLGWIALFSLASGTMISSGIFILPGLAYSRLGSLAPLSYLLAGVVALMSSLALIELSTAMPKAGGDYFYITRSLGPMVGTVMGLLSWLALMLKTAFAIYGLAEMGYLFFGFPLQITALALTGIFLLINLAGTEGAVRFEIILVAILLIIMLIYSVFGTLRWEGGIFQAGVAYMQEQLLENPAAVGRNGTAPGGMFIRSIIATAAFVFVSFGGLLNVSTMAEEVKKPGRDIPRAILTAVAAITVLYVAMVAVTSAVLPPEVFSGSLTPIADGASSMLGSTGLYVIAIASSLAFITTGNAGLMSASRYPLAMSRDGLLPRGISGENKKGIPVAALCTTALFIGFSILIPLEALVKLASTVILISYMAVNIAVIVLRESGVRNYRPLFSLPGYPLVPVLSLVFMGIFLVELGISSIEILLLFAGGGLLLYLLYGKRQNSYEYAALHLIKKAVDSRLQKDGLESELRGILRSREQLSQDLTDRLLADALTIDIDYRESVHGAFQMAGSRLAPKIGMTSEEITQNLEQRESRFTTALTDFVSIPHILIPGQDEIHLVLLRDREGLYFDDSHPSIHAMFIIVGSEDRRDDHLKLIAGLAHVIQHKSFTDIWLSASSMDDLKDQLILLDRKRLD